MYSVEQQHPNGTTTVYGPIRRRKTADRVLGLLEGSSGDRYAVRELTPWRQVLRARRSQAVSS